jgi:redox-sensitive bicupin YhaK (pirin superfamily)
MIVQEFFVLRADARGHGHYKSTGQSSSYIAGHPDAFLTRHSSFNFHEYQSGRPGFGRMRVFGDEVFSRAGCGYNMHPHHNFVICAFVLQGQLTHINTVGNIDQLTTDDYYVFSAGSGGKHSEVNLGDEDMGAIYVWFLPNQLLLAPSYHRKHFDRQDGRNRLILLVGDSEGALPIPQDVRVSRLVTDTSMTQSYRPKSIRHGVYAFVIEGKVQCIGATLGRRDSIEIRGADMIEVRTGTDMTDILIVESIM